MFVYNICMYIKFKIIYLINYLLFIFYYKVINIYDIIGYKLLYIYVGKEKFKYFSFNIRIFYKFWNRVFFYKKFYIVWKFIYMYVCYNDYGISLWFDCCINIYVFILNM